jgi:LDH2 family malate/lactate/ureidoglycolate dehydrogenase
MVRCAAGPLQEFTAELVTAFGAPDEIASEVARHLVRANLSGHDSHGVLRLPQYANEVEAGHLVPYARPSIRRESDSVALFDAQQGFGHFSTMVAADWCIERAQRTGVAVAAVRRSTHIGRLGEYSEKAAEQGLIGIVTVGVAGDGLGSVAPFGGVTRFLGTNPWTIAVPAADGRNLVFDAATSAIAEGKARLARAKGASLPAGAIIDAEGQPSTDPHRFYAGGALLPVGGQVAGHKGYGLGLAAALVGSLAMIEDAGATTAGASVGAPVPDAWCAGVAVIVIDPRWFGDGGEYARMSAAVLDAARQVRPAPGVEAVLVPGDPERSSQERRQRDGIEIPEATWAELREVAARFQVSLPDSTA